MQSHTKLAIRMRAALGTFYPSFSGDLCIVSLRTRSIFDLQMNLKMARVTAAAQDLGIGQTCTPYNKTQSTSHQITRIFPLMERERRSHMLNFCLALAMRSSQFLLQTKSPAPWGNPLLTVKGTKDRSAQFPKNIASLVPQLTLAPEACSNCRRL